MIYNNTPAPTGVIPLFGEIKASIQHDKVKESRGIAKTSSLGQQNRCIHIDSSYFK